MVFGGAVDRVLSRPAPTPQAGDVVVVCDGSEKPIGWGVFNPNSMFRVRCVEQKEGVARKHTGCICGKYQVPEPFSHTHPPTHPFPPQTG